MKNFKKGLILFGMVACLMGGIGTAIAIEKQAATNNGQESFDQAVSLFWDSGSSSSATMPDMETVLPKTNQYNYLTVAPKSSKSVAGTVTLTFTLSVVEINDATKTATIKGLTVKVFQTEKLEDDSTVKEAIQGKDPKVTLTSTALSGTTTFAIEASSAAHETKVFYAIQVYYDNTDYTPTDVLSGQLMVSQAFAATPAQA